MACKKIFFLINILLLVAVSFSAPAEKAPEAAEPVERIEQQKEDLVSASEDLKPAASHWGGGWGGYGGHWGGHYGGYYPYYGSYWGGYPSYGYGGYGYWPYGGYGHYGFGHHGYWW